MTRLTVTEKEHWKSRIESRIKNVITSLEAKDPQLLPTIRAKAVSLAHSQLGTLHLREKIDSNRKQCASLEAEAKTLESGMIQKVLGPQAMSRGEYYARLDFEAALGKHTDHIEIELLEQSSLGREMLKLRREMDALLDTVWLATCNSQIRDLWQKVSAVLGDGCTELQQAIIEQMSQSADSN